MGIIEKMRLDGKAIYVTGAASGIGKCAAMAFAEAGADVAVVDINIEGAQAVAKEIAEATGSKTIAIQCDVTDQEQVEAMVAKVVDTYGKLDACYNNAGIALNVPAEEMSYEQWLKVININLNGVFLCATAAGRVMLKPGYIGTDLIMNAPHLKPLIEQWNAMAPMGRLGKPEELQSVLVYLAGDTSSFTTGSDIVVDGAFTCF